MQLAIAIFAVVYILMIALPKYRAYVAFGGAFLFVALGYVPLLGVFSAIDWNVILMIAGTMGTVALFIESQMPARLADMIIDKAPDVRTTVIALSLFAGVISAFVDNVATVLMVAPVAVTIAKKLKISPVPSVIAIAIASNLQGAATLVGDTTSILLGGYAKMNFLDFFWYAKRPGMFFIVQVGMICATAMLVWVLRKYNQPVTIDEYTPVTDYVPTYLLLGTILVLIVISFIPEKPAISNGLVCVLFMLIGIAYEGSKHGFGNVFVSTMKEVDYFTLLLLGSLFVVIAGIQNAGVIDAIAAFFVKIGGGSPFLMYSLILWASVLLSAVIDNIPYVATMLPVATGIAGIMGGRPTCFISAFCAAPPWAETSPPSALPPISRGLAFCAKKATRWATPPL